MNQHIFPASFIYDYLFRPLMVAFFTYGIGLGSVFGQTSAAMHQYDALINHFSEKGNLDRLFYYGKKKAALAQSADSLAVWLSVQKKMADTDAVFDSTQYALDFCRKVAADLWRSPRNAEESQMVMRLECTMGWHCKVLGQFLQSIQHYEAANKIYEQFRFPNFDVVTYIYKAQGNNYTKLGENEKALVIHNKALVLGGDPESLAGTYLNIGKAYHTRRDFGAAEIYFQQGLALTTVSDARKADLWCALAIVQMELQHYTQAVRSVETTFKLLDRAFKNKADRCYDCYSNASKAMASILLKMGKYKEALKYIDAALKEAQVESAQREIAKTLDTRANILIKLGQCEAAIITTNKALSIILPSFSPLSLDENPSIGSFYEENTIGEALDTKAKALMALCQKNKDIRWLHCAAECYDLAWKSDHKLRESYQYSSAKLELQNYVRERDELAIEVVYLLYQKTLDPQYIQKGFDIAERNKSALLADALQDNLLKQGLTDQDTMLRQITMMRRQRALYEIDLMIDPSNKDAPQWRNQKDALQKLITDLEQQISNKYGLGIETQEVQFAMNGGSTVFKGGTLVTYFITESVVNIFVFQDHQAPIWTTVAHDSNLRLLVQSYLRFFSDQDAILGQPEAYFKVAAQLAALLLPPAAYSGQALLIIPDGFAHFIPFEALLTTTPTANTTLRNAPYLIRSKPISYAWSFATWQQQQQLKHHPTDYLLGVAPRFEARQRGLSPLLSEKNEWETDKSHHSDQLLESKANYQGFLKSCEQYSILHLNTHAFADHPSRIELYDQALYLPEIFALSLQANLVVLSACQTGLGTNQKGEGVMSLARAFAHAGAACIISSLWSVNDRSTARLFKFFYEGIDAQKSTRDALQHAKLQYIDDLETNNTAQSPYFWAGFIMVGDDRTIAGAPTNQYALFWIAGLVICCFMLWFYRQKNL